MNEALKTALASALLAAQEALAAAQTGKFAEARDLLAIMDEHLENGQGGNAAAGQRRAKILRLEAQTRALLPAEPAPAADAEPTPADAEPEALPSAPAPVPFPAPQEPESTPPAADAAPSTLPAADGPQDAPAKVRGSAAPVHLSAAAWANVGDALRARGVTAEQRDEVEDAAARAQTAAREAGERHAAKVAQREALQARVEACALRGDVDGANAAWDTLFDVVTALRSAEGSARRKGQPDPVKQAAHEAASAANLRIRQWARGTGSAA